MELFINNIFLVVFFGIIEFFFFKKIVMNYVPINSSFIVNNTFDVFKYKLLSNI
jgi:hypothetical protein